MPLKIFEIQCVIWFDSDQANLTVITFFVLHCVKSKRKKKMGEKSRSRGWCGWIIVLIVLAVVVAAVVLTIKKKSKHSNEAAPVPGPPGAPVKKYGDALQIAMQFFDVQKCRFL